MVDSMKPVHLRVDVTFDFEEHENQYLAAIISLQAQGARVTRRSLAEKFRQAVFTTGFTEDIELSDALGPFNLCLDELEDDAIEKAKKILERLRP